MKRKANPPARDAAQLALGLESLEAVSYRLRRSKEGSALSIRREGDVFEVSAPSDMPRAAIEESLREQPLAAPRVQSPVPGLPAVWAEGAALQFQGRELRLQLDPAAHQCQLHEQALILPLPRDAGAERIRDTASAWLQGEARSLLGLQLGTLASRLRVPVPPWALSFSSRQLAQFEKGQLRLNWKLVLLPPDNLEAVIRRLLEPHIIPPRSVGLFD